MAKEKNKSKDIKTYNKKRKKGNYKHEIFFVAVIFTCIGLLSMVILLTGKYTSVLNEQVETRAATNASLAIESYNNRINKIKSDVKRFADVIIGSDTDIHSVAGSIIASEDAADLATIAWCHNGAIESLNGGLNTDSDDVILAAAGASDITFTGIVFDKDMVMERFAVSVPVESERAESIVFVYDLSVFDNFKKDFDADRIKESAFIVFCRSNGRIMEIIENKDSLLQPNVDLINGVRQITGKKTAADDLSALLTAHGSGVTLTEVNGASCAIAVAKNPAYDDFGFVFLYNAREIYGTGYNYISIILASIMIIVLVILIFSIYFVVSKRGLNKRITEFGMRNEQVGCLTKNGFERDANKIVEENPKSRFAVIVVGIRRFEYIIEIFGQQRSMDLLKELRASIYKQLTPGETFGYDIKGEFLMLMHYTDDKTLVQRLRHMYNFVYKNLSNEDCNVRLNFGICISSPGEKINVAQFVSNSKFAMKESGLEKMDGNYTVYDEKIRNKYMEISDLEVRMEKGINEKEFKVFYQPKYNVDGDCMDGCEALVRWYDEATGEYKAPGTFLPLLEENGYISMLDHHVFSTVCKFIADCVSKGIKVIPVSVNVSRYTMLEKNFVTDYIKIKEANNIPDDFLTLEFTESAAYENNEVLAAISKTLRKHGFLCSIDDFGTGYSSYNMLKVLDIDEVKLDRFFIENCLTSERARVIIEGAIATVNKLKIKVTQEGVEDLETFNYLKGIGCNVIQGYYYSRPLMQDDFVRFMETHRQK